MSFVSVSSLEAGRRGCWAMDDHQSGDILLFAPSSLPLFISRPQLPSFPIPSLFFPTPSSHSPTPSVSPIPPPGAGPFPITHTRTRAVFVFVRTYLILL